MLADEVVEYRIRRRGALMLEDLELPDHIAEPWRQYVEEIQAEIQLAERIAIADATVAALTHLELGDLQGLGENLDLALPPFPRTWIEWPNATRAEITRSQFAPGSNQGWMPKRSGYLILADDDNPRRGSIFPFISKDYGIPVIHPAQFDYDLDAPSIQSFTGSETKVLFNAFEGAFGDLGIPRTDHKTMFKDTKSATATRAAAARIAGAFKIRDDEDTVGGRIIAELNEIDPRIGAKAFQDFFMQNLLDMKFLLAALLMLNTKNFATLEPGEDFSRINAKRLKKGRLPLLDHRILKIRPSRVQAVRGDSEAGTRKRFHHCRGHLKRRITSDGDTRLFWWSDHWRGDPSIGHIAKTYEL